MNLNQNQNMTLGKKLGRTGLNLFRTIAAPVLVYLFFYIICAATGVQGFGVGGDFKTMIMSSVYNGFIALAMSYNLTSGRFDFAVGASMILSIIIGCLITLQFGLGSIAMLLLIVVTGMILGLGSGLVYVGLKLPPMITSLGVAMIYEAIAFTLNNSEGVKMLSKFSLLIYARMPGNLILLGVVLIILIFLLNFTQFGYNTRSLQSGQKNAVEVGINEKRNAVACYVLAGALMGCAGAVFISQYGIVQPKMGLASSSVFMGAFLPLFIGGALAKYSDRNIGIIIGAFIQSIISSGLVKLGFSNSLQSVLNGLIVLIFLVYVSNAYKFVLAKMYKIKKARAEKLAQNG